MTARSLTPRVLALCLVLLGCTEATDGGADAGATGASGGEGGMGGAGEPEPTGEGPSASGGNGAGGAGAGGMNQVGAGGTNAVVECTAEPYAHSFEFGAIFEGWSISTFSTPSLIPMEPAAVAAFQVVPDDAGVNDAGTLGPVVADAGGRDGGAPVGLADASTPDMPADSLDASTPVAPGFTGTLMELDTNEGAPDSPNGALKFTIPFDGPGQLLLIDHVFNTGLNFEDTVVTAKIKLASGLITGPADTATANLVLKATDSWVYYAGPAVVLDPSADWVTLTLDPDAPPASVQAAGFNACDVREIDIEIHTGATGTFQEAVIYIDSISVAPKAE